MSMTPESLENAAVVDMPNAGVAQEQRSSTRISSPTNAQLVGWGGCDPIPCVIENLAEGGMFVHANDVPELCVGRRYEVIVDTESKTNLVDLIGEGCYATVIRTQVVSNEGSTKIGAGLRFDQPLLF